MYLRRNWGSSDLISLFVSQGVTLTASTASFDQRSVARRDTGYDHIGQFFACRRVGTDLRFRQSIGERGYMLAREKYEIDVATAEVYREVSMEIRGIVT